MGTEIHTTMVAALQDLVQQHNWKILETKDIAHGIQFTITDGQAKVPVALYHTGRSLVQGKSSSLQETLRSWCNQYQSATRSHAPIQQNTLLSAPPSTSPQATGVARIGSDESGKGDYFGPLVIAAVYVDVKTEKDLLTLGIRDSKQISDSTIQVLAQEIKHICHQQGTVRIYLPERYNQLYQKYQNLNHLLADAHAAVIHSVANRVTARLAIVDQFGDPSLVREAVVRTGCPLPIEQRPRAEDDTAVAAASIIARAEFVKQLTQLSHQVGFPLPKGASAPSIIEIGRQIVTQKGMDALNQIAKLHFKTTEAIQNGL